MSSKSLNPGDHPAGNDEDKFFIPLGVKVVTNPVSLIVQLFGFP
jgi:hypothetical protein